MHKRLGVAGIVIEDTTVVPAVNAILHEFAELIVGRMGIPYRARGVSIVSIILDGCTDDISALTGRLGRVPGVSVKTALTREAALAIPETEKEA
jgi:putative iron-only hydrogenase system regulator